MANEIHLNWNGPYRFVEGTADLPSDEAGVYFFAVPVNGEYLPHYIGEAGKVVSRWSDHLLNLLGGRYRVFDPDLLCRGEGLRELYRDEGGPTNLTKFSGEVARAAFEYARATPCFCALFQSDSALRECVESGIIQAVGQSGPAGRLLVNHAVSRLPPNACKVRWRSTWPAGIRVAGIPDVFEYGQRE
jgi:hypothetical protein